MSEPTPSSPEYDPPIIAKQRKGKSIQSELLASENEAEVYRDSFIDEQGEQHYVRKNYTATEVEAWTQPFTQEKARQAYEIYTRMHDMRLPVAEWAKVTLQHSSTVDREQSFGMAMQDATEGGRYELLSLGHKTRESSKGKTSLYILAEQEDMGDALAYKMIEALAVLHNNGIYEYHPNISFFLKVNINDPHDVSFIILDYSNFADSSWSTRYQDGFDTGTRSNLMILLDGVTSPNSNVRDSLTEYYHYLRASHKKMYDPA